MSATAPTGPRPVTTSSTCALGHDARARPSRPAEDMSYLGFYLEGSKPFKVTVVFFRFRRHSHASVCDHRRGPPDRGRGPPSGGAISTTSHRVQRGPRRRIEARPARDPRKIIIA
jgi:hypothetical protein